MIVIDLGNKDTENMLHPMVLFSFLFELKYKAIDFSLTLQSHLDKYLMYLRILQLTHEFFIADKPS